MNKLKVIFIDQIYKVNYKYSYNLVKHLNQNGIEMYVVADQKTSDNIKIFNYFNSTEKVNRLNKLYNYFLSWEKILSLAKKNDISVIHIQWFLFSPLDYYFLHKLKKIGKKIVVTIHDILPFNEKRYDYVCHKKIYNLADEIIVQAKVNKERLLDTFTIEKEKIKYIPHGNFVEYGEVIEKSFAKSHLGIDKNKKVILFFGQIKKVKGLGILIEAMTKVIKKYPNCLLVIAGKTFDEKFDDYENQIISNELQDYVKCDIKFIPDEDVKYYFNACEFVVLPYINIFQSGVIQLCYAYEKAPIATNVGGFPEVVLDQVTGKLVEVNNVDDLAEAIVYLLNNEEKLKTMGIEGKKFMQDNFSWEKIAEKVKECYI